MKRTEFVNYLKAVIDEDYGGSQVGFAESYGISPAYLSDVLNGRRKPGKKILDAVGFERVDDYQRKS